MRKLILQMVLHQALIRAMNIDMGVFKLDKENEIDTKSRYVYSDHNENKTEPLENASAKFDLGVYQ